MVSFRYGYMLAGKSPSPPKCPHTLLRMLSPAHVRALSCAARGVGVGFAVRAALRALECIDHASQITPLGLAVLEVSQGAA